MQDYDIITIRLRKGDREALQHFFQLIPYNRTIRNIISTVVDNLRKSGTATLPPDALENLDKAQDPSV